MKNSFFSVLLTVLFLLSLSVESQIPNCPIKKINGVEYYSYTVQSSEGLYGISRKFGVSLEAISKANPEVESGIRAGQQLNIPVVKSAELAKNETKEVVGSSNKGVKFIQHEVEKKQTLFAISHKYNVSQEELIHYNPQLSEGLKEGEVLKIPISKDLTKKETETSAAPAVKSPESAPKQVVVHKVVPKETLYSISKLYQVGVVDIIQLNPLAAGNLVVGSELKIQTAVKLSAPSSAKEEGSNEVGSVIVSTENEGEVIPQALPEKKRAIRIAFLLPFMLDQEKEDKINERFIDFYAGSLLAFQEAKQKGISLEVFTYDTGNSEEKIKEILGQSELKTVDLIIGPAFSNHIPAVSEFAKENKINTLIPFSSKIPNIEKNSFLFQFNPGFEAELKMSKELVNHRLKGMNVIFAEIAGITSTDGGLLMANKLKIELSKQQKNYTTIQLIANKKDNFKTAIKSGAKNLIVFNTDKFAYINSYLSQLRQSSVGNDVVLFEQYNWRNQVVKLPASIYVSPFIAKPDSSAMISFNEKFVAAFHRDPTQTSPRYHLLGYDLSTYFISLIDRYGCNVSKEVANFSNINGIQSQARFEQFSKESGFVNQQLYIGEDQ